MESGVSLDSVRGSTSGGPGVSLGLTTRVSPVLPVVSSVVVWRISSVGGLESVLPVCGLFIDGDSTITSSPSMSASMPSESTVSGLMEGEVCLEPRAGKEFSSV